MTSLVIAIAFCSTPATKVDDFFPLQPGTKWTYQEQGAPSEMVDEVLEPVEMGGKKTTPIRTTISGSPLETRYFRIEGDTVFLVGTKADTPLPSPHPVLKIGDKESAWTFAGLTDAGKDGQGISFEAKTAPKGKKKLFGSDHACYEMVLNADVDQGAGVRLRVKQVTTYAEGIGWVEMKQTVTYNGQSRETVTRLVRFEKAPR